MTEELDVKIGTPDEAMWTDVLKEAKELVKQSERHIKVQRGIIELAESKIAAEKEKLK